jgi:hypothetical protein
MGCALKAQPRGRGVQFQIGAVLQRSNNPSRRVAGFEDEDEDDDENEATSSGERVGLQFF